MHSINGFKTVVVDTVAGEIIASYPFRSDWHPVQFDPDICQDLTKE
jgi:hypothetical protein